MIRQKKRPQQLRKPVVALTPEDLQRSPIWEFACDEEAVEGQDDTWVRPVAAESVGRGRFSQLVAATLRTAGGLSFPGFMVVTTAKESAGVEPGALLHPNGYFCLPAITRAEAMRHGHSWSLKERDVLVAAVGLPETEVFPISYCIMAKVAGKRGAVEGVIR